MASVKNGNSKRGKKIGAYILLAVIIIGVLVSGWIWYKQYTKYYTTDDAYIDADRVAVSSKILGRITAVYGDEGDTVPAGKLLVTLDSSDLVAQRDQAAAARDQAVAAKQQAEARYELDKKNTRVQEIGLEKAKDDLDRATVQYKSNVIPKEQFDHLTKAYESAVAQLDASQAQLTVSKAMIGSAESAVKASAAQVSTIETNLRNTRIYAPCAGLIARRWLLPGDIVQPGQAVFTITKDSLRWVVAYFEETKVGGIHDRQAAEFTVDAFPDVIFTGKVFNIGTNTAAQFSIIPPNNASGNFTKVTQRIPVKISILNDSRNDSTLIRRLVSGMSVVVKIYK
jgi:membrane fusion protein (multidrug efflux system)